MSASIDEEGSGGVRGGLHGELDRPPIEAMVRQRPRREER